VRTRLDRIVGQWKCAPRYRRVALLLVRGLSDKEIAAHTGLTLSTVRTYVKHVYKFAGVHGRVELVCLMFNQSSSDS
jgi:DNA-binding NarL/FixJ family response regulator